MSADKSDPSEPIRLKASRYPGFESGTSCTQSSFKTGKGAFLYIGMQGGRHKAMFKLQKSMPEARKLAEKQPDRFQVGSTAWVTARFTTEEPIPKKLWEKWLDESYELAVASGAGTKSAKKNVPKKKATKKLAKKKPAKKK